MLHIRIISVGRVRQKFVLDGELEYLTRLKSEAKIELIEMEGEAGSNLKVEEIQQRESERVLDKVRPEEFLIVLDERGKQFTSPDLAARIEQLMTEGRSKLCIVIGGAYGWHETMRKKAHLVLSLSSLTFPYQMVRLILIEQLYRALSIIKNSPYHK